MPAVGGHTALLNIDMIICFDFEGVERLEQKARGVAEVVRKPKAQARAAGAPVIYVNDMMSAASSRWRPCKDRLGQKLPRRASSR